MARFETIAFDVDDTLWHSERLYVNTQAKFKGSWPIITIPNGLKNVYTKLRCEICSILATASKPLPFR